MLCRELLGLSAHWELDLALQRIMFVLSVPQHILLEI